MKLTRTNTAVVLALGALILLLVGGGLWQARRVTAESAEQALRHTVDAYGLKPLNAPPPAADPALIALGEALFLETELSGNRDTSCATCHVIELSTVDQLPLAIGTGGRGPAPARELGNGRQFVPRNTPDLFNRGAAELTTMFWDGRVSGTAATGFISPAGDYLPAGLDSALAVQSLIAMASRHEMRGGVYNAAGYLIQPGDDPATYQADQAAAGGQPIGWGDWDVNGQPNELAAFGNEPADMALVWQAVLARVLALPRYQALFTAAYPTTPLADLTPAHMANALAAYQAAEFVLPPTPWDRYLAGDSAALDTEAKQGALLFYGTAGCAACHTGSLFTDQQYYNLAVPQFGPGMDGRIPLDYGRYQTTVDPLDRYAFRTPSLRQVTQTGPWFHNGAYDNLEDVVRHHLNPTAALAGYDGAQLPAALRPTLQNEAVTTAQILQTLAPQVARPTPLTDAEVRYLLAFLESLTAE